MRLAPAGRRLPAAGLLLALVLASAGAPAAPPRPSLDLGLETAAGYDSNIFLTGPNDPATVPLARDGFAQLAPRLDAVLGWRRGHRLELHYDLLYRQFFRQGNLRDHVLRLAYRAPPVGGLRLLVAAEGERFDLSPFPEDRFLLAAGAVGLERPVGRWVPFARARLGWRFYADAARDGQLDRDLRAEAGLRVQARLRRLDLVAEVAYGLAQLESTLDRIDLLQHGGLVAVELAHGRTRLAGGYELTGTTYAQLRSTRTGEVRRDLAHRAWARLAVRLVGPLEAFVRYDVKRSTSSDARFETPPGSDVGEVGGGDYARQQVLGGLSVLWAPFPRARRARSGAGGAAGAGLAPVRTGPGRWRFRLHAPGARSVVLLGSFNGWDPSRHPLRPGADRGTWETEITLPPGEHRYSFLVDDGGGLRPVRPPDAPRYVRDGLGGWNGVLVVPGEGP